MKNKKNTYSSCRFSYDCRVRDWVTFWVGFERPAAQTWITGLYTAIAAAYSCPECTHARTNERDRPQCIVFFFFRSVENHTTHSFVMHVFVELYTSWDDLLSPRRLLFFGIVNCEWKLSRKVFQLRSAVTGLNTKRFYNKCIFGAPPPSLSLLCVVSCTSCMTPKTYRLFFSYFFLFFFSCLNLFLYPEEGAFSVP